MHRVEGRALVAYWLLGCCGFATVRLATYIPTLLENLAGWRAVVGPAVGCVLGVGAAIQLLRRQRGMILAYVVIGLQIIAISAGPLAYRLDLGPFIRLSASAAGVGTDLGSDARLLFILGSGNHVPDGIAINVLALAVLLILIASRRSAPDVDDH